MADGIYAGTLPADIPAGRCTLSIRLGTFDTADDPDDKPEQRIPTGATLTLTPNVTGPVILPDGTIMVVKGTVLTSDTGTFDFWAIDGQHASVNPTGWNWTATLKIDASTQVKFTFSPDSTSPTPLNLGTRIPISDPQTGVATVVGRGVASISVDPDTSHVLFVMSDNTTYDAGSIPPGPPGPPNSLSIGTVTTGATGTAAAASITGTAPSQTLNLTLPAGPKGDAGSGGGGPNTHTGTGFPAAGLGAVGDTYLDTAATNGALIWRKWPSGWRVEQGDTGWRDISSLWQSSAISANGSVQVRRVNGNVTLNYYFSRGSIGEIPASVFGGVEFFPAAKEFWLHTIGDAYSLIRGDVIGTAWRAATAGSSTVGNHYRGTVTYLPYTNNWPSTLPGTPA